MIDYSQFTVLMVDDVPRNLQILGNLLQHEKIKTHLTLNGKNALELLEEKQVDLILLDVSMPEMTGFDVIKVLKSQEYTKDIPVIFVTAHTQIEDIVMGFEHGAVDYVTKPYNSKELMQRVKNHLELQYTKKQLQKRNKELEELNSAKNKFFSIVAHDLKSPFNSILGFARILKDRYESFTPEKHKQFINVVFSAAENGFKFLENLLEWARSQMEQITPVPVSINLHHLLTSVKNEAELQIINKELNVSVECDDEVIFADENMAKTIIRNLLTNAIKFTSVQGNIELSAESNEDFIVIKVKDSGVGIPEGTLPHLFSMERTVTTPGTQGEKGTGLGLILCKEFLEKNGGSISVESKENMGTTFSISLPKAGSIQY